MSIHANSLQAAFLHQNSINSKKMKILSSRFVLNNSFLKSGGLSEFSPHKFKGTELRDSNHNVELKEDCLKGPQNLNQMIFEPSKRIIVLGSDQFEIIKKSEYLLGNFCVLINIVGGMICYHFSGKQKKEVVELLKAGPQSTCKCLSIGDGLNDAMMIELSHASVQIAHKGFVNLGADVVCFDFGPVNAIMFNYAIYLPRNVWLVFYHVGFSVGHIGIMNFAYQFMCGFSGSTSYIYSEFSIIQALQMTLAGIFLILGENYPSTPGKPRALLYYLNSQVLQSTNTLLKYLLMTVGSVTTLNIIINTLIFPLITTDHGEYIDQQIYQMMNLIYWQMLVLIHLMLITHKSKKYVICYAYLP